MPSTAQVQYNQAMQERRIPVSCLTVSQRGRLALLRGAVSDFAQQTYRPRELLIVVYDSDYAADVEALAAACPEPIYVIKVSGRHTLGTLRNVSLEHAHGRVLCQWDDDDRYAPDRLALQMDALVESAVNACFLHQQLHFFAATRELFWTDWRLQAGRAVQPAAAQIIPGTVMFRTSDARYPETGAMAERGEDSVFAARIARAGAIAIDTPPGTYLRQYHGNNTWQLGHHRNNALLRSSPLDALRGERSRIEAALSAFDISPPVRVMSADRLAFTYDG